MHNGCELRRWRSRWCYDLFYLALAITSYGAAACAGLFGGGPHQRIGNGFALVELQLVPATVAQRFRLELLRPGEIAPEPLGTLRPLGGLPVRVRRRS